MNEFTQKMGDMERRIRELEDKLRAVRTPPTVVATPGKRLTLNDHFNVADWAQQFARHTHTQFNTPMLFGSEAGGVRIEADGTVVLLGDATTTMDIVCPLIVRTTGVGRPSLATLVGNILQYQFAVGDSAEIESSEFPHNWKQGSEIEIHLHWALGAANDATVRGVKWEVEYSYTSSHGGSFSGTTVVSAETAIEAGAADRKMFYTSVHTFTPVETVLIGTQILARAKRIAATGTAPAADPFALAVGLHYLVDGFGSRTRAIK